MTVDPTFAREGDPPPNKRRKKSEENPVLAVTVPVLVNTKAIHRAEPLVFTNLQELENLDYEPEEANE